MKLKGLILTLFVLMGGLVSSNAQDVDLKDVPASIKAAFSKMYPQAKDIEWEMKGSDYEASFDIGKTDHKAIYTPTGKVVSYQKEIPKAQLPAGIAKSIKIKYPKTRIDGVDWINTEGKITYKVDLEGVPDVNVWYGADGKFIREVAD